jgi:hypothetical protein
MAAMAAGAGIAAAQVADDLGLTIEVIGTPAEEVGNAGGKTLLLERGAFEGIHAAMVVHPNPMPFDDIGEVTLAVALFDVHFFSHEERLRPLPRPCSFRRLLLPRLDCRVNTDSSEHAWISRS